MMYSNKDTLDISLVWLSLVINMQTLLYIVYIKAGKFRKEEEENGCMYGIYYTQCPLELINMCTRRDQEN